MVTGAAVRRPLGCGSAGSRRARRGRLWALAVRLPSTERVTARHPYSAHVPNVINMNPVGVSVRRITGRKSTRNVVSPVTVIRAAGTHTYYAEPHASPSRLAPAAAHIPGHPDRPAIRSEARPEPARHQANMTYTCRRDTPSSPQPHPHAQPSRWWAAGRSPRPDAPARVTGHRAATTTAPTTTGAANRCQQNRRSNVPTRLASKTAGSKRSPAQSRSVRCSAWAGSVHAASNV